MRPTPTCPTSRRFLGIGLALAVAATLIALPQAGGTATAQAPGGEHETVTATFGFTGSMQPWTVPFGVSEVTIVATGAPGGDAARHDQPKTPGGKGTIVTSTVPIPAGVKTLYVVVGSRGTDDDSPQSGAGGYNGGGHGAAYGFVHASGGAGGGGATDVRTSFDLGSRLVVAGGGGGAGSPTGSDDNVGGQGGNPNEPWGRDGRPASVGGNGGVRGGQDGGGAGGTNKGAQDGRGGWLGQGGAGGGATVFQNGGGGGGGGYYGGGGGAAGVNGVVVRGSGGGGGAGSSFSVAPDPRLDLADRDPGVVISYVVPERPTMVCPTPHLTFGVGDTLSGLKVCESDGYPLPPLFLVEGTGTLPPGISFRRATPTSTDVVLDGTFTTPGTYSWYFLAEGTFGAVAPMTITVHPARTTTTELVDALSPRWTQESRSQLLAFVQVPGSDERPPGQVTLREGGTVVATRPLASVHDSRTDTDVWAAAFDSLLVARSLGTKTFTATYEGPGRFLPSTSAPLAVTVDRVAIEVRVEASQNPSVAGQPVTYTARAVTAAGLPLASAAVVFRVDGQPTGGPPLAMAPEPGSNALVAQSPPVTGLGVGNHVVLAHVLSDGTAEEGWGTLSGGQAVTTGVGGIADVDDEHPFFEPISWLVGTGIARGFDDGSFHPTDTVSRQAIAAFLYRLDTEACWPSMWPDHDVLATDLDAGHPFHQEITWLLSTGLAAGFTDGSFHPTSTVTRQAAAAFLHRLDQLTGGHTPTGDPATFTDVPADHPFHDAITWLAATGVTEGFPDGTFRPSAPLTRQAMAALLQRLTTGICG